MCVWGQIPGGGVRWIGIPDGGGGGGELYAVCRVITRQSVSQSQALSLNGAIFFGLTAKKMKWIIV